MKRLAEALDESVYGAKGLASAVGEAPLVVVPVIGEKEARKRRFGLWIGMAVGIGLVCIVAAIFAYHLLVSPIDVWWFSTLRKYGLG